MGADDRPPSIPFTFEPLERSHKTRDFRCGEDELDHWLDRCALTSHRKDTARVFVAVQPGERSVRAFYTLSNASLSLDQLDEGERRGLPDPIPATLIGRMAVHRDLQRRGLGRSTIADALARAERASHSSASYLVLVVPIVADVRSFYLGVGFVPVPGASTRLMYRMADVRKLGLSGSEELAVAG